MMENTALKDIIASLKTAGAQLREQQLAEYADGLEEIIKHTEEPLMLMVMGSFSTGKSSFINALVGEEIAAVEAKPTTAVVTKLCYGAADKLTVYFRDGRSKQYSPAAFARLTAVNDDAHSNAVHAEIDYVERQMPIDILRQVSIIDSPGLNDVNTQRSDAAEGFVQKADSVLWMFSSMQAASRQEINAMDRLTPRLKPIAVVNKMDLIDEEEDDPQEFLAKIKSTLQDRVQAVIGISAKYALEGKRENNALKTRLGNMAELGEAIMTLVVPHRDAYKMNTLLDELGYYFNAFNEYFLGFKAANNAKKDTDYAAYIETEQQILRIEEILGTVVGVIQDYCEREAGRCNEQALFLLGVLYHGIGTAKCMETAYQWFSKSAEQGYAAAQYAMGYYYAQNAAEKARWYRKAAEQGYAAAEDALGDCYFNGDGVPLHKKLAYCWYKKAAEQGLAVAQNWVGRYLEEGWAGVTVDKAKAVEWYKKAAEQGLANAQSNLAVCLLFGRGVAENKREAYKWFKKAAKKGDVDAQWIVGRYLEDGWGGVTVDEEEAVEWYKKAAEQGLADAQFNLGDCFIHGNGIAANAKKAVEWYKKAAEQGMSEAEYVLGECYRNGVGIAKNISLAYQWYKRAAAKGHAGAENALGECYRIGDGVLQNHKIAYDWYKKAAKQGVVYAQNMVGRYLEEGWGGVTVDKEKAVEWYIKAAEQGLAIAQNNLACCLYNGEGVVENKREAYRWYKKAAEQEDADAQNIVGWYLKKGLGGVAVDKVKAVEWFRQAAEQGHSIAQNNLAFCFDRGEGVSENKAEAYQWFLKAADQGVDKAQYMIGRYLESGEGGAPVDKDTAYLWYKAAAEQGHAEAQKKVIEYQNSKLNKVSIERSNNENKHIENIRQAAENGDAVAQCNLANHFYTGGLLDQDISVAIYWYKKSAAQDNAIAQYALGNCYFYGIGVEENKVLAYDLYKRAAKQGHAKAQKKVAEYLEQGTGNVPVNKEAAAQWRGQAQAAQAAQSSGCLLPILGALAVLVCMALF